MKSTFVMRVNYDDLFQDLTSQQAGEVIKAVFAFVHKRALPTFSSAEARITFKCIQKDITYDINKYKAACERNKQAAQKRWAAKHAKKCARMPDEDEEMMKRRDDKLLFTAQADAAQGASNFSGGKETTTANTLAATGPHLAAHTQLPAVNPLEAFADEVAKHFESHIHTDEQKQIWFKRNARCLRDIFNFCDKDKTLALKTIGVCAARLAKAGLVGGYEAVCRNLPEYCAKAEKQLRDQGYQPGAG